MNYSDIIKMAKDAKKDIEKRLDAEKAEKMMFVVDEFQNKLGFIPEKIIMFENADPLVAHIGRLKIAALHNYDYYSQVNFRVIGDYSYSPNINSHDELLMAITNKREWDIPKW